MPYSYFGSNLLFEKTSGSGESSDYVQCIIPELACCVGLCCCRMIPTHLAVLD